MKTTYSIKEKSMLNSYERLILESLLKKDRCIEDISKDTSLDLNIIQNALMSLLTKCFIKKELDLYCVIKDQVKAYQNTKEAMEDQISERELLLHSMLYKSTPLSFFKVYLNEKDEIILKGMIKNLQVFLTEAQKNKNNNATKEEKIFIFGENNYVNTIKNITA